MVTEFPYASERMITDNNDIYKQTTSMVTLD